MPEAAPAAIENGVVQGRVTADGVGMPGIDVSLVVPYRDDQVWRTVRTGPGGGFRFDGVPRDVWAVRAVAEGQVFVDPLPFVDLEEERRVTVEVKAARLRRVLGTVSGPGGPVASARVAVWDGPGDRLLSETSSDAAGRFELPAPDTDLEIEAVGGGLCARRPLRAGVDALDLALDPACAALDLRVLPGRDGQALPIAFVQATPEPRRYEIGPGETLYTGLTPGPVTISLLTRDVATEDTRVDLPHAGVVEVRGKPLGSIQVTGGVARISSGPFVPSGDGCVARDLPAGRYMIWRGNAGDDGPVVDVQLHPGEDLVVPAPTGVTTTRRIVGRVVDAGSGSPLAGIRVQRLGAHVTTGPDGRFTLPLYGLGFSDGLEINTDGYWSCMHPGAAPGGSPYDTAELELPFSFPLDADWQVGDVALRPAVPDPADRAR